MALCSVPQEPPAVPKAPEVDVAIFEAQPAADQDIDSEEEMDYYFSEDEGWSDTETDWSFLTHCDLVMPYYILDNSGSGNGLAPLWHPTIRWTNDGSVLWHIDRLLSDKLWYLQHSCVWDTIVYH